MKLISCHIENFGKLRDFDIDFVDKKNIICQENGWGKSTLTAFIRAMFYGMDGKRRLKIEENDYQHYTPWQDGVFGGRLTFETNGKKYVITRTFGARADFELRDADTNIISHDFSENIGKELFQVDRESFVRTAFISQNDCKTSTTDDINSKIGNLTDNTKDLNNYEKADKTLKELMASLTPKRVSGSIRKRVDEITELRREVLAGERIGESMTAYQEYLKAETEHYESIKAEKAGVTKEQGRISKLQVVIAKQDEWKKLKQTYESRKTALVSARKRFPGEIPEASDTALNIQKCTILETTAERIKMYSMTEAECAELRKLETAFDGRVPDTSEIDAMQDTVRDLNKRTTKIEEKHSQLSTKREIAATLAKNQRKTISPFIYVGTMLAVIGVVLAVTLSLIAGISVIVVAIGLVVFGIIGNKKEKESERAQEILDLEAEMKQMQTEKDRIVHKVMSYLERYESVLGTYLKEEHFADDLYTLRSKYAEYLSLCQKRADLCAAQKEYENVWTSVTTFLQAYQYQPELDVRKQLNEIKENISRYQTARGLYEEARVQLKDFESLADVSALREKMIAESLPSLEELNTKVNELANEINEIQSRIQGYNRTLEGLQEQYDEWEEKKIRLEELLILQEKEQKKYELIEKTKMYLGMAKESLTAKYAGPILNKFKEYYEIITGDSAAKFYMDANTKVTVEELGKQHETEALSAGYRDLIGICLRIALVDAMYREEAPMLIMDDPFVNLDDKKLEAAKKLLDYIAEKYQVIYFTCNESRC